MNNSEIVKDLSLRLDETQKEIKRILGVSSEIIRENLDRDKTIAIPGLGTFHAVLRNERRAYNPFMKKMMLLPKKRAVKYHPSSTIKEQFKNKRVGS